MKKQLFGRYITYPMIAPLLDKYPFEEVISLGTSVKGTAINLYRVGKGNKKILMWSQMHGNESTATKALFDVLNELKTADFLSKLSVYCIPMLNPDGAEVFTRVNVYGKLMNLYSPIIALICTTSALFSV